MAEIKIKIDALESKIKELQTLQRRISSNVTTCPKVVGGGSSVNELEKIANTYKTLNSSMLLLVMNTTLMDNLKESYVEVKKLQIKSLQNKILILFDFIRISTGGGLCYEIFLNHQNRRF